MITLAGGALRASFLNHPMRYDESLVYFDYVVCPLLDVATRYDGVCNHILHSVLEHVAFRLGGNSPSVLRLPAIISGTALIPLAIGLGFILTRQGSYGLLAGGLVAVSSVLVDYSTNARGYLMVCAFTLGMCLCTLVLIHPPEHNCRRTPRSRVVWPIWALMGALGAFTIPTMLFPTLGFAAILTLHALMVCRPRRRRIQLVRLAITLVSCGALTLLFYLPALWRTGIGKILAQRDGVAQYTATYLNSASDVARLTLHNWTRDMTIPVLLLGVAGLALGLVQAFRKRSIIWSMPWILLIVGIAIAGVLSVLPYPRVWLYMLPVVLAFSVSGLALIQSASMRRLAVAVMALSILVGGYRVGRREFLTSEIPYTLLDAELIAENCARWPNREFGLVMFPLTEAVHFYAHRRGLPRPAHPADPRVRATYVVVHDTQSLEDVLTAKGGAWCREYGKPRLYETLPHGRIYRMDRMVAPDQIVRTSEQP